MIIGSCRALPNTLFTSSKPMRQNINREGGQVIGLYTVMVRECYSSMSILMGPPVRIWFAM